MNTERILLITFVMLLILYAILVQLWMGHVLSMLISETDHMATTEEEILHICKKKFSNCYRLYNGVVNVPIFVERYLEKIKLGRFSMDFWKHMVNQCILFAVFVSGIGIYRGIVGGHSLGEILPYYFVSILGLYFHFAVSSFVDITAKKKTLSVCLVDYLENHMGNKIMELQNRLDKLDSEGENEEINFSQKLRPNRIQNMEENSELEALLREFLA